jgi:hypothetical protein
VAWPSSCGTGKTKVTEKGSMDLGFDRMPILGNAHGLVFTRVTVKERRGHWWQIEE